MLRIRTPWSATLVSGDANTGTVANLDYTPLTGTVTIAAGDTDATIDVSVLDDLILEDDETVIVTLGALTSGDSEITVDATPATVTIGDDDTATASVSANDAVAGEPADNGQFTVTLDNPSDTDTVISYTVSGDANTGTVANADYTPLVGTVTIAAGDTSTTIDVTVLDDSIVEATETVVVTLDSVTSGDADISVDATAATVTISDDDTAVLSVVQLQNGSETGPVPGQFEITMSNPSSTDTTVFFTLGGTADQGSDFTVSTPVIIPAGSTSVILDITTIDDAIVELTETVTITITASDNGVITPDFGNETAMLTIADNDSAVVRITRAQDGAEAPVTPTAGRFDVELLDPITLLPVIASTDTVLLYTVTGSATEGVDYSSTSGLVNIPAGTSLKNISIPVIDDLLLEGTETVTIQLDTFSPVANPNITILQVTDPSNLTGPLVNSVDSLDIFDDESAAIVTFVADNVTVNEADGTVTLTLQVSDAVADGFDVDYTLIAGSATGEGDDYSSSGVTTGTATFVGGNAAETVTITIPIVQNGTLEGDETFTIAFGTITPVSAPSGSVTAAGLATVTITDDDSATATIATTTAAAEPGTDGVFTVSLDAPSDTDTVISYTVGGDATAGSGSAGDDYQSLGGTVTITAGATSATIDVSVFDDLTLEDDETVIVTLDNVDSGDADISIDATPAVLTISDDDSATATVAATTSAASEPSTDGLFTVSLDNPADVDTVIGYTVSGDATAGDDYTMLTGLVTIAAGDTDATIDVSVIDDSIVEASETVEVTLTSLVSGDTDITVDATPATVVIADDDTATASVAANDASASEPADNGQFTITLDAVSSTDTVVNYSVTGDATAGDDYDALTSSVTIAAGDTSATIDVNVIDNGTLEDDETVIVTLDSTDNGAIGVDATAATVTISDEDTATATVTANIAAAAEPGTNGQFAVTLSAPADEPTVIGYTVGGDANTGTVGNVDYTPLTGTVTIAAGDTVATIDVSVLDDSVLEDDETVTVTLDAAITSGDADISTDVTPATVTISDDDAADATVTATIATASEPGTDGEFTITLSNPSDTDTTINLNISGTAIGGDDYAILTTVITILAGDTTAVIPVSVIDDSILETLETVIVEIDSVVGDGDITADLTPATVTIADDEALTVSIAAGNDGAEDATNGSFVVSLVGGTSATDTVVTVSATGGDAIDGTDFTIPVDVTIAAGDTSATLDVTTLADGIVELDETVEVTLGAQTSGNSVTVDATAATITIADDDTAEVTVTATDNAASEVGPDDGQFVVTLSAPSSTPTVVTLTPSGTADNSDLTAAVPTTVTFAPGQTAITVDVTPIADNLVEGTEALILTASIASPGTDADADITVGSPDSATVTIADGDSALISVVATDDAGAENPDDDGTLRFEIDTPAAADVTFTYTIAGSADAGDDYTSLTGTGTIAAGDTFVEVTVDVLDDNIVELDETVEVTLDSVTITGAPTASIAIDASSDNATVTIASDDTATLFFDLTKTVGGDYNMIDVLEGGTIDGQFSIVLSNPVAFGVQVGYSFSDGSTPSITISGDTINSAENPADYLAINGLVFFSAGVTEVPIDVIPNDDLLDEGTEFVELVLTDVLTPGSGAPGDGLVSIITTDTATMADDEIVFIGDNDQAPVANDDTFAVDENSADGVIVGTVIATDDNLPMDTLTYTVTGGTGATAFVIDSATGEITVDDSAQLDFETTPSFTLDVLVTDSTGLTDTATITIDLNDLVEDGPEVTDLILDSTSWAGIFRDFVDGGFNDGIDEGYRLSSAPAGTSVPWINVDTIKVQFDGDVGASLDVADFILTGQNGFDQDFLLGNIPTITTVTFNSANNTATLALSSEMGPNAFSLTVLAAGVTDGVNPMLADSTSDFIVLPGDVVDLSSSTPGGLYLVNGPDSSASSAANNGFLFDAPGTKRHRRWVLWIRPKS